MPLRAIILIRSAMAICLFVLTACNSESNGRSSSSDTSGTAKCPVLSIDYKNLGPPGPPDIEVDSSRILFRNYGRGSASFEEHQAKIEVEDWRSLQTIACSELKRKVAPKQTDVVGGNQFLRIRTAEGSASHDLSGEDLYQVPVMKELNRLTQVYFQIPLKK